MGSRVLLILAAGWILCCPALCADAHSADRAAPAKGSSGPHEHEHDCFCSGDSLPSAAPALLTHHLDSPLVQLSVPARAALPELALREPDTARAPAWPILPGAQPLLI